MKKLLLFSTLSLSFISVSYSQLGGLNRLKEKTKNNSPKEEVRPAPNNNNASGNNSSDASTEGNSGSISSVEDAESRISAISSAGNWDAIRNVPMGYNEYVKMRDTYKSNSKKKKYYIDQLPACDKYYSEWIPKVLAESILPDMEKTQQLLEKSKQSNPGWVIQECKSSLSIIEMYLSAKPNEPKLEKCKKYFQQLQKEEEEFIASGGDKRYEESQKNEEIANEQMPKAVMKNPSWEKSAKELIEQSSEGGPVLKVVLVDNGWNIEKDDLGIPLRRAQTMYVAYKSKSNGQCYYKQVDACQQYAGGGTYNSKIYFLDYDKDIKILCENVNK